MMLGIYHSHPYILSTTVLSDNVRQRFGVNVILCSAILSANEAQYQIIYTDLTVILKLVLSQELELRPGSKGSSLTARNNLVW